jgi:hypothetical protein
MMKPEPDRAILSVSTKFACQFAAAVLLSCASEKIIAQESASPQPMLVRTYPGGFCPLPVITSIASTQGLTVNWTGFGGPYQLEQSPVIGGTNWTPVGAPTTATSLTVTNAANSSFFRVQGQTPKFAGVRTCQLCHDDSYDVWSHTAHAGALDTLKSMGSQTDQSCLPCHTMGFGTPNESMGKMSMDNSMQVECENCHGPAADHAAHPLDESKRPPAPESALLCGGCHTTTPGGGPQKPSYDEWKTSKHATVVPAVAQLIRTTGDSAMLACGPCHSGAVRRTLEDGNPLPAVEDAASLGISCAVCHDPMTASTNQFQSFQLRSPMSSMQPFSYDNSTNNTFDAQYDDTLNICARCHNMRGATWQDTSRPPHHSPQYNILIGKGGFEEATNAPPQSEHGYIDIQCAQCHMHPTTVTSPTPENPNYTGHTFEPRMDACEVCHITETAATAVMASTQTNLKQRIAVVKGLLDRWATTKASAALRGKYGSLAWEYSVVGELSDPTQSLPGPTDREQADVPDGIKQARFNLYLVQHDGSFGVHNANYSKYLLQVAQDMVTAELGKTGL